MNIENELREYITKEYLPGTKLIKLENDFDLIKSGILDSQAIIQLVTHIEETYEIELGTGEIIADNLGSINRLVNFVERKLKDQ